MDATEPQMIMFWGEWNQGSMVGPMPSGRALPVVQEYPMWMGKLAHALPLAPGEGGE